MNQTVHKVVLLPRFTSFSGARVFRTSPINVRALSGGYVSVWAAEGMGTDPTFELVIESSVDLLVWDELESFEPTPGGAEETLHVLFQQEWIRIAVTLTGTDPAFVCWAVGNFVTRQERAR